MIIEIDNKTGKTTTYKTMYEFEYTHNKKIDTDIKIAMPSYMIDAVFDAWHMYRNRTRFEGDELIMEFDRKENKIKFYHKCLCKKTNTLIHFVYDCHNLTGIYDIAGCITSADVTLHKLQKIQIHHT